MTRLITLAALLVLSAPAHAAQTYEQALAQDVVKAMSGASPEIPDAVEDAYWQCWSSSFVQAHVASADLARLDALAAAGNSADPLAAKYRDRVDAALTNPDGDDNAAVEVLMDLTCPDTLEKLRSY